MKILFIDCGMGAAGDMLTAALLDLLSEDEKKDFVKRIEKLENHGISFELTNVVKCGITGSHVTVKVHGEEEESHDYHEHAHEEHDHEHHDHEHHNHEHHHHHTSFEDVCSIIDGLNANEEVKAHAKAVYKTLAEAEAHVHGTEISDIHFHEVGTMDAIVDITSVCMLMDYIKPDKVVASPIHVGAGKVHCAHGVLPVPAPATAFLLTGLPTYGGRIEAELCTPTGAALLRYFVNDYSGQPVMKVNKIGYGMGNKDFEVLNAVRVMLGETEGASDTVFELSCNVDDMTAEEIGFALEVLMSKGARDAFAIPIVMKKSRPGHLIKVITDASRKSDMVELLFKHTTTLGIRETECSRYVLERHEELTDTPYGKVHKKVSSGYGVRREKLEYEDLKKIALENDLSLYDLR